MSLIFPDGSRTVSLPPPQRRHGQPMGDAVPFNRPPATPGGAAMPVSRPAGPQAIPSGWSNFPVSKPAPYTPAPSAADNQSQMLEFLYGQLKEMYPGIEDADLREAARRMLDQVRGAQSKDFYTKFFPERQQAPAAHPKPSQWTAAPSTAKPIAPPSQGTPYNPQAQVGLPNPRAFNGSPLENLTDEEIAALNANERAKGPSVNKRYYRTDDGKAAVAM